MADTLTVLKTFAEWIGYGVETVPKVVDAFAAKHPELIEPPDPEAPPEASTGDLDPTVLAEIKNKEL